MEIWFCGNFLKWNLYITNIHRWTSISRCLTKTWAPISRYSFNRVRSVSYLFGLFFYSSGGRVKWMNTLLFCFKKLTNKDFNYVFQWLPCKFHLLEHDFYLFHYYNIFLFILMGNLSFSFTANNHKTYELLESCFSSRHEHVFKDRHALSAALNESRASKFS